MNLLEAFLFGLLLLAIALSLPLDYLQVAGL